MTEKPRILIVCDGASWFVRRVACTEEDMASGQMVYRCDEHLAGPYKTLSTLVRYLPKSAGGRGETKRRRKSKLYFNPRDVAILGGDPSL